MIFFSEDDISEKYTTWSNMVRQQKEEPGGPPPGVRKEIDCY